MSIGIKKVATTLQDLALGHGQRTQVRGGVSGTYDEFNASYLPTTAGDVQSDIDARSTDADNQLTFALKNGEAGETFLVADPTLAGHASNMGYTDAGDQAVYDSLNTAKAEKSNVLEKDSIEPYTPTAATHPANVQYVLDTVQAIGAGDMAKSIYDIDNTGVVDDSQSLGGVPASQAMTYKGVMTDTEDPQLQTGIYSGTDVLNSPVGGLVYMEYFNDLQPSDNDGQRLLSLVTKKWYYRTKTSGTFDSWTAIIDDADIINGLGGSQSATAVLHAQQGLVLDQNKFDKAGGNITGDVSITSGSSPEFKITPTDDLGYPITAFTDSSGNTRFAVVYSSPTGSGVLQVRDAEGNFVNTAFKADGNIASATTAPIEASDLTRKDYVESRDPYTNDTLRSARLVTGDWNDVTQGGWYRGNGLLNSPVTAWVYVMHMTYNSDYQTQVAYDLDNASDGMWKRRKRAGAWEQWKQLGFMSWDGTTLDITL